MVLKLLAVAITPAIVSAPILELDLPGWQVVDDEITVIIDAGTKSWVGEGFLQFYRIYFNLSNLQNTGFAPTRLKVGCSIQQNFSAMQIP